MIAKQKRFFRVGLFAGVMSTPDHLGVTTIAWTLLFSEACTSG